MTAARDWAAFDRLAPPLQRWLWEQGWKELRDAQAAALPLILEGARDVVIAAATASGKTEAAFLPLLTRLHEAGGRGVVLYVAPVRALINDQGLRLGLMCERLELPVVPWHGDVGETARRRFLNEPRGVVLITPESLESLLFRRGADIANIFAALVAVVVDELHAFIGGERGRQLQSLLHRLEEALGRCVPRIGLSATLGDMRLAAEFLRPGKGEEVAIIVGAAAGKALQLVCKAIVRADDDGEAGDAAHGAIATEMFDRLRDANYLIFPNTTGMVEFYADALRRRCEAAGYRSASFLIMGGWERQSGKRPNYRSNKAANRLAPSAPPRWKWASISARFAAWYRLARRARWPVYASGSAEPAGGQMPPQCFGNTVSSMRGIRMSWACKACRRNSYRRWQSSVCSSHIGSSRRLWVHCIIRPWCNRCLL